MLFISTFSPFISSLSEVVVASGNTNQRIIYIKVVCQTCTHTTKQLIVFISEKALWSYSSHTFALCLRRRCVAVRLLFLLTSQLFTYTCFFGFKIFGTTHTFYYSIHIIICN